MKCISPFHHKVDGFDYIFPCGHCTACRLNRSAEWTMRLTHELQSWKSGVFVTLTYDDEHLPLSPSGKPNLVKSDLQKFFKRLRKRLGNRKIKYFACGEYGSPEYTERCHFHAIIFGLDATNMADRQLIIDSWTFCDPRIFEWRAKRNAIDVANMHDIAYVAGYIQKKLYGSAAKDTYGDRTPPFSIMSQGLGLEYFRNSSRKMYKAWLCAFRWYEARFSSVLQEKDSHPTEQAGVSIRIASYRMGTGNQGPKTRTDNCS